MKLSISHLHRFCLRLPSILVRETLVLCLSVVLTATGSGDLPLAWAQAVVEPLPPEIPQDPFHSPSAAAIMAIMRQKGLLPRPSPATELRTESLPSAPLEGLPGVNVLVNNPNDDLPERTTQSEVSLAVRGDTIVAGYNTSEPGGFSGRSRSTDLGATWTQLPGLGRSGDPVLAVHQASGIFYYAELADFPGGSALEIGVARSIDDGQTFTAPVNASPVAFGLVGFQDKPWIAVDNTGGLRDGNVYVCWTRFAGNGEIRFSRSLNNGLTFQDEQVISRPTDLFPFGCHIDVGPNGEVYVAYSDRGAGFPIIFRRSLNGGDPGTFLPSVQVNSLPIRQPGTDRFRMCEVQRPTLNGDIRMLPQAWMAVDTSGGPFNGNIYIVWAHDPPGAVDNSDIFFSRSVDGGVMWSPEVQIDVTAGAPGGATDQFEPFVEVNGRGVISIAWYDRRNDPASNFNIDVFKTFSTDGGAGFLPIVRVTDTSFPVPPINPNFDPGVVACYMGEYIAIAADRNHFFYAWGDNRNTLVTANFPGGRPDPDVRFDREEFLEAGQTDLSITKVDNPDPVKVGGELTYRLRVRNLGPSDATGVIVTDTLPANVNFVSASSGCSRSGSVVTCEIGTVRDGESAVRLIRVRPTVPGGFSNTATVRANEPDPDPANNTVTTVTTVK
jgi:uncharacterized repeat protein (TIGR01451 family)